MDGWVGTLYDLRHVGVELLQILMPFWLKMGSGLPLPCRSCGWYVKLLLYNLVSVFSTTTEAVSATCQASLFVTSR